MEQDKKDINQYTNSPQDVPNTKAINSNKKFIYKSALFLLLITITGIFYFIYMNNVSRTPFESENKTVTKDNSQSFNNEVKENDQFSENGENDTETVKEIKTSIKDENYKLDIINDLTITIFNDNNSYDLLQLPSNISIKGARISPDGTQIHLNLDSYAYDGNPNPPSGCIEMNYIYKNINYGTSIAQLPKKSETGSCYQNGFIQNSDNYFYGKYINDGDTIAYYMLNDEKETELFSYPQKPNLSLPIEGIDKEKYIYPDENFKLNNNKTFVAFESHIFVFNDSNFKEPYIISIADCEKEEFIETDYCLNTYRGQPSYAYYFDSASLLVPMFFSFEGPRTLIGTFDLSGKTPKFILNKGYNLQDNVYMELQDYYYSDGNLVFIVPTYDNYSMYPMNPNIEKLITSEYPYSQKDRETILKYIKENNPNYEKVFCDFDNMNAYQGAPNGCYALKSTKEVVIKPNSGLSEIKL